MKTSGNTILITGGATGLGLGLAKAFKDAGNEVIICGRRENRLNEAAALVPGIHTFICDVASADGRTNLAEWAYRHFPGLNILINNAGVQKSLNLDDPADVNRRASEEIEINLTAPIHLSSLFIPLLSKQKDAAIINITSGLAFAPLAMYPVYCATKAALHSFSMSLRHRLSKTIVKVFEIAPPLVQTELKVPADNGHPEMNAHGITVQAFSDEAMEAFKNDKYEYAVGQAENMRQKRDELFPVMNPPLK
jgi:uncharacterized oxidoreductase